jgi:hypothetical protein
VRLLNPVAIRLFFGSYAAQTGTMLGLFGEKIQFIFHFIIGLRCTKTRKKSPSNFRRIGAANKILL